MSKRQVSLNSDPIILAYILLRTVYKSNPKNTICHRAPEIDHYCFSSDVRVHK